MSQEVQRCGYHAVLRNKLGNFRTAFGYEAYLPQRRSINGGGSLQYCTVATSVETSKLTNLIVVVEVRGRSPNGRG